MTETIRLVDHAGRPTGGELPPPRTLLAGYRDLVLARRFNEQADALAKQGRLAVYPSSHGQEACQVAAAAVLADGDWLFPTYRDAAAVVARGVHPAQALSLFRGDWHCGYDPRATHVAPQATPLATQLPHAVGVAHAATLRGESTVVMALCGDGATSEGDFHEAMTFAGVFSVPAVFLVQNNKYAISVPLSRQTAASTLADKGSGYGVRSVRVDGNDLAALLVVLDEAVRRAREGGGPTLVEADTYRVHPHTNADDPSRYRGDDEVQHWLARDPLSRLREYLTGAGVLTADREAEIAAEAEELAAVMRSAATTPVDVDDLFAHVYAERTPQLVEQADGV
jgi:pyruvate dehydrogenase E1 component alpha subunit